MENPKKPKDRENLTPEEELVARLLVAGNSHRAITQVLKCYGEGSHAS